MKGHCEDQIILLICLSCRRHLINGCAFLPHSFYCYRVNLWFSGGPRCASIIYNPEPWSHLPSAPHRPQSTLGFPRPEDFLEKCKVTQGNTLMLRLQNTPEYGVLYVCCPILILHWFECLMGIVQGCGLSKFNNSDSYI